MSRRPLIHKALPFLGTLVGIFSIALEERGGLLIRALYQSLLWGGGGLGPALTYPAAGLRIL